MNQIILDKIDIVDNIIYYHYTTSGKVGTLLKANVLWIDYGQEDVSNIPDSILVIPFVSVMLPFIWVSNATLWVNEIDRTFYNSTFALRRAYNDIYPRYPLTGKIVPSYIIENSISNKDEGFMLFSGGVDAHTSYIRHINQITTLVNIQGWYSDINGKDKAAEADFSDIYHFSQLENKKFVGIRSNFATIADLKAYKQYAKQIGDSLWHGFQHSMGFISIAIPLVYKNNGGEIFIASSFTVGDSRVCASYPTTDNEFIFAENGKTVHDGFELSRQDKIRVIVEHQKCIKKPYPIRVCSFNDHNCCHCEKCFRTILGLVAEGANLQDFGFYLNKPILDYYEDFFKHHMALFGVHNESLTHWPHIKKRMLHNYDKIPQYHDFIDWFMSYDFIGAKKKAVREYYMSNIFSILKRKIKDYQ